MNRNHVLNLVADDADFGAAPAHVQQFAAAVREHLEDGGDELVAAVLARWTTEAAPRSYEGNLELKLQDFVRRARTLGVDGGLVPAARAVLSILGDIRQERQWPFLADDNARSVYFWDCLGCLVAAEADSIPGAHLEHLAFWWAKTHQKAGFWNGNVGIALGDQAGRMSDAAVAWLATSEGAHSPFWREAMRRRLPIWEPEESFRAARERHERFEADAALVPALREAAREGQPWSWLAVIRRWWESLPPAERPPVETVRAIAARWCPSVWRTDAWGDTYDATEEAVAEVIR